MSILAYAALLLWPLVALFLYSRLPIGRATLWTILGGYLLLPAEPGIKFQMIPTFDKTSIPNLAAFLGCAVYSRKVPKILWGFGLPELLVIVLLIVPFITSLLNSDTIRIGQTVLPGVGAYDAGSASRDAFIFMLPFFLGRQFSRSADDNMYVLWALVIAGLVYSLAVLFEYRMGPQLAPLIYGYNRGGINEAGDVRPVVFGDNPLMMAFFFVPVVIAAGALWRLRSHIARFPPGATTAYLSVILLLFKSFGYMVYGVVLIPIVRWASPRLQLRLACVLVTLALIYPLLRVAELIPTDSILNEVAVLSPAKAGSLKTRFDSEEQLLDRAWERPWFGWGRYGRNRIYDGWNGADSTLSDGHWVLQMGSFGLVGFVAEFGLLALCVFRAAMSLKFTRTMKESVCLAALALIVAINTFDLLPNGWIMPLTWLLAGTLVGRAEALSEASRQPVRSQEKLVLALRS
jgi:hypothetical protein